MSDEFPEALQIEVTNKCNLKCQMCIRHVWKAKPLDMDLALFKKIAESCFSKLKRLILYGFGEPFIHPRILELLRIARKNLPEDGEIIVSTNGSLITPKIVKEIGVNSICFSIDTVNPAKLSRIREGSDFRLIAQNIESLVKNRNRSKRDFRLGLEIVIMKDNFSDIPNLVKFAAEKEIDYIIASHIIPYTEDILAKTVYITLSKPAIDILKPSLKYGWNLIRESTLELFGRAYGVKMGAASTQLIRNFWMEAERRGYWINLPLLLNSAGKLEMINCLENVFHESGKAAHEYQIDLKLPNIYPDAKERSCPYIENKTMAVRSDGKVSPCQEFLYAHPIYVNAHKKSMDEVIFGDITKESVKEIWCQETYVNFRKVRKNMAGKVPWCGDCPYSTLGCFYTLTNNVDCYANSPTCNECLYSANLAQCNILSP